jgi:CDP-glycerol glycerophosphotransferase (TagB/SpsB family)
MKKRNKIIKTTIIKKFIYISLFPVYLISKLIPKKKNQIVFGSSSGLHFSDNAKYLFSHLDNSTHNFNSIWLTKNKKLNDDMHQREKNSVYLYTIKGLWILLRAEKAVITHKLDDLCPPFMGGLHIIQLWHGTPLKKIGFDADGWDELSKFKKKLKLLFYRVFPYMNYLHCHSLIISSEKLIPVFSKAFNIKKEKIKILGQPRNDSLSEKYNFLSEELNIEEYSQIVSWLPTHRGTSGVGINELLVNFSFDFKEINTFLKEKNMLFVIKPHFVEVENTENIFESYDNIIVYKEADPYPLLQKTDILITDYSSVYFDYLLKDKPIIFTPFDYQFYKDSIAGFYFKYNNVTPGPKCSNWKEVFYWIENNNKNEVEYSVDRKTIKRDFNKYEDSYSIRVLNFLEKTEELK